LFIEFDCLGLVSVLAKSTRQQKFELVKSKSKSGDSSSVASNYSNLNGEKISHR